MKIENIKINPKWGKTREEIWNVIFESLEETFRITLFKTNQRTLWYYVVIYISLIILMVPTVAFFHTHKEISVRGNHLTINLPDGSRVNLNAESEISYKPLWWKFSREVKLKGEAYFEIEEGNAFSVHSGENIVSALGASFNISSRLEKYNVTCLTGKVIVSSKQQSLVLTPGMQAVWNNGHFITRQMEDATLAITWKEGRFVFMQVPLREVIQEIERQYNIKVTTSSDLDYIYSGIFTKSTDPKDVLKVIGTPFGIEFKIQ